MGGWKLAAGCNDNLTLTPMAQSAGTHTQSGLATHPSLLHPNLLSRHCLHYRLCCQRCQLCTMPPLLSLPPLHLVPPLPPLPSLKSEGPSNSHRLCGTKCTWLNPSCQKGIFTYKVQSTKLFINFCLLLPGRLLDNSPLSLF